ncbi:protein brunelleschi [Musca domestica]|uniref:Protein brunelleschi n=1 Tax=Musca domestica TaxID=7370 RepID=A0A9J7D5C1_MUSDO|nr:protein brunelleschi [Musca domestica]
MSRPDYEQTILHHSTLLVLLRGVGVSKPRSLQKVFDKVKRVNNVKIQDSSGVVRDIWVRYIHDYPVENNDWGDFQTHRRLLGLITIGKFENQAELNEMCRQHESLKVRYVSTLYDSRAIFFGPAETTTTNVPQTATNHIDSNESAHLDTIKENIATESMQDSPATNNSSKRLLDEFTTPSNFKAQAFFYRENDMCSDLEHHMVDFVNALFWVLESRRLERSREKMEKWTLIMAPFEKRDFVGLDMESRNNRKRVGGRIVKNLADLSLQAGLINEALTLYHNACETLRSINDILWLGAAEEGLCSASACLLFPQLRVDETLHRNASLQEGSPLKCTPNKWRQSEITKRYNSNDRSINHQQEEEHNDVPATTPAHQATPHSASTSSVSSILTNSTLSQASTNSTSSSSSTISTLSATSPRHHSELPGNILKPDEILTFFKNAIIKYSKYSHAAIVEIESAFKASRIMIEQNRPLDVAMFLQNVLYVTHNMTEAERIKSFEMMTSLYLQIGYRRKAAFFQRLAALKHAHQNSSNTDWSQTYRLMLSSFPGYMLSLDPLEVLEYKSGWPSLQIDVLQSLITAAKCLGHSTLATRHMTFLLQTQWHNMSLAGQSEMAVQLSNLSAQCEGSPVPLVLENGTVIPPANLTDLPFCMDIVVKDLPAHMRPQRIKIAKADSGPFLFTPLQFNSMDRRDKNKDKNKIAFFWVQNNVSEVSVRLRNPLPFDLTVSDMRLLTNGIVFKSLPQTVILQPEKPTLITLHGTPMEVGQLEIQGYSTHTLGVKSNCRMKHMKGRKFPQNFMVDVIPALPMIGVKTSLPQTATFSNMSGADTVITTASLTLYNGESSMCVITITNNSDIPVEHLEITINSNLEQDIQKKVFQIEDDLQAKLPIAPQSSIDFKLNIFAEADFICPIVNQAPASIHSNSTLTQHPYDHSHSLQYSSTLSSGHTSLPSRVGSPSQYQQQVSAATTRRNDMAYSSFRSTTSTAQHSSLATLSLTTADTNSLHQAQPIDAQIRIKYSGGEAMQEGYCRQCAVYFKLECIQSAQITSWDVLPAEVPSQFYLVLDITNLTAQEMTLNYTNNKTISMEANESCRVPIPVDRCSVEEVWAAREAEIAENLEKELCFRTEMGTFNDSVSRLCSKHIAERVKIKWSLTGTDIQGIASLKGIVLTQAMIDLCTVSPLQWNISFKNQPVQPQSEVVCTAGQSSLLSITVCNQSLQPLKNLILTIKFYQDYLNGTENYNLETRVAISGPNRVRIPILKKDEKVNHECTVLFFTPGRFKTSIQCHAKPQQQQKHSPANSMLSRSCPANDPNLHITLNDITVGAQSYHEQQEHIWKFIPPIEVTVVEQQ